MMLRILRGATFVLLAAAALDAAAAPCPATTVLPSTSLPGATVGVNYSQAFTASNTNSLPFTFAVTSGLPAASGLSFTGANLGGSPTQIGNYIITVSATDSSGCTGGRTYGLAIAQGTQTISFTSTAPAAATVGGAPYAVAATATSGLPVTLAIDAASSAVCTLAGGNVTFQGAGTCTINANQAGNANYAAAAQVQQSFAVGPGAQTITFTSTAPANATINGPTYTATATASSGLPVTLSIDASASAICSIVGATVSFTGAGTCVINANQAGNANYSAAPQVQQSFAVAKIDQTITFTSTAPAGAVFGGPTYEVAATASSGLAVAFAIDAASATVCSISGTTVSIIGAGACTINANQAGDATYNAAPQVQQSFTVGKADQTITFTSTAPATASIGGPTYTVAATATSTLAVTFAIDPSASAVCSMAGGVVSFTAAGTCVINANQPGDANWNAAPQVQQSFTVSNCVSLALGQVQNLPSGTTSFCVSNAAGTDTEYTYMPMSFETGSDVTLSLTAAGIQAVTGPPTPRPGDGGLALAPLANASSTSGFVDMHEADLRLGSPFPAERGYDLSDLVLTAKGGVTPLVVGQLIDLNASVGGCGVATDIRKGRVEAITTAQSAGQPLLYAVQEVVETSPGSGVWNPPVPGGFATQDFQAIMDSFVQLPPGDTGAGSGTLGTLLRTGGMDISRTNLGTVSDVDNNGGVILFFTPAMNALSPPASSQIAFALFQPRDLFSTASCGGSNQHEMLYLMVPDPTGAVNSNVRTLSFIFGGAPAQLTHHYEHLANASRRLYFNGAAPFEQTWLDEGLAWEMQELTFFSASVGLVPRTNVGLADLTTGPNASRRVADFNQYQNPMYGHWRTYLYQLNGTTTNRRAGPLRQIPYSASTIPTVHENVSQPAAAAQIFLRYALDRKNTGDAALINALVNTNNVGIANLQAAFGVTIQDWARDFVVAMYTDDAVAGVTPEYTNPSWNYRSVFGGLGGFPLATNPLTDNTALVFILGPGGGSRFARFGVATGGTANVTLTQGGGVPAATVVSSIVRTK